MSRAIFAEEVGVILSEIGLVEWDALLVEVEAAFVQFAVHQECTVPVWEWSMSESSPFGLAFEWAKHAGAPRWPAVVLLFEPVEAVMSGPTFFDKRVVVDDPGYRAVAHAVNFLGADTQADSDLLGGGASAAWQS